MDLATLEARLAGFPRLSLGSESTPIYPMERLSAQVQKGQRPTPLLWIKRDDVLGAAMGGNKARCLEFLMAEAKQQHARKVVTFGGLQSNHVRMTAEVSRKLGMEPHLFFFKSRPRVLTGSLLLNSLLDAKMHFIPLGGDAGMSLEATNRLVRLLSWARVGPSYFIPVGGFSALGCLGYVVASAEIHKQVQELGLSNVTVVAGAGTGGTLAGLLAGLRLLDSPVRVLGIDVGRLWKGFRSSIAHLAGKVCQLLGEPHRFSNSDVPLIEERYVGTAYGTTCVEGNAACRRLAECEGVFLDPIYTGKAMAGMLDLIERGDLAQDGTIVFLHTGGIPGLFAFPEVTSR